VTSCDNSISAEVAFLLREERGAWAPCVLPSIENDGPSQLTIPANVVPETPSSLHTELETICLLIEGALDQGDTYEARRLLTEVTTRCDGALTSKWDYLNDIRLWTDAWLVAAIRRDPPDSESLDELAHRHWKSLFGRCQMITLNRESANDLAQEAWHRVLRARTKLNPEKNFPAYLHTIAMNIWRDRSRSERRAGPMGEKRLASLDAELAGEEGQMILLGDAVPDLAGMAPDAQSLLKMDIDQALAQLAPELREVLVARLLNGESCAEIGRRHNRTEQTISGWVRQAVKEMKDYLEGRNAMTATSRTT
jgi:RNA polymerase sigma factor (sigma-70 family)